MTRLSFKEFQELCELNLDKKHIDECLDIIKNRDCLFHSGIAMPNEHIASLYRTRFKIAKDNKKLTDDYIKDFEDAVHNLNISSSNFLALAALYTDHSGFIVFYEPERKTVLGVLKSNLLKGVQAMEDDADSTVRNGYSSSFEKYSKGQLVKQWD